MVTKPVSQVHPVDPAGSEIEHETLLVIDGGGDLGAVEDEEGLHGGVPDSLVAVDEWVVLNQREAQRRGLLNHGRIEIDAAERRLWLSNGRVKRSKLADAGRAPAKLAWRTRRCNSTTSPRGRYRIRRGADIAPRSSAGRGQRRARTPGRASPADP